MYTISDKPPVVKVNENGSETTCYEYGEKHFYKIEIFKRELYKSTDRYSTIEDDGEPMRVCFFPTNEQKIYFRILEEIDTNVR